jgi:hypothetical protein
MSTFSVVIPSKSVSNVLSCIRAIRAAGETCRIIVVDDGVDWPFDEPPKELGNFEAFMGVGPFVFSRNVNLGIVAAGTDDVIVMNDDALLKTPRGFTALAEAADDLGGIVSAACANTGNPNQAPQPGGNLRIERRMVCFVCVCIPRFVIDRVGLLDEDFVDYGCEDDDYCFRVRQAGLPICIYDGCVVDHESLTSSFRGLGGGDFKTNLRRFIRKHGVDNWGRGCEQSQWKELF